MKSFAYVVLALTTLTVTACGGGDDTSDDATDVAIDAARVTIDGAVDAATVDARPIDAPPGTACTGALYDPCTGNTECTGGMCKTFGGSGFSVCTQTCSAASPCPMQNGAAVPCNNMGICKPSAPNVCTR